MHHPIPSADGSLTVRRVRMIGPPGERRGLETRGHIVKLFVGQGCGFIRGELGNNDVYFHRSDVQAGGSINDLVIGDAVAFELLADIVSGPRALRVRRCCL